MSAEALELNRQEARLAAGKDYEDKRPRDRYANESKRLLGVLETRLTGRDWIMGADYTIADIALLGWVRNLIGFYGAGELVGGFRGRASRRRHRSERQRW